MTFDTWCKHKHYRISTIRVSLRHIAKAQRLRAAGAELQDNLQHSMRRYLAYATAVPDGADVDAELIRWLETQGVSALSRTPRAKPKRRKYEAVSYADTDWSALEAHIAKLDSAEACVIRCLMVTGLRIGDVLRLEREVLKQGIEAGVLPLERKGGTFQMVPIGGATEEWHTLLEEMTEADADTVAELVCPANPSPEAADAAYMRVRRALQHACTASGVQGRSNLHRIRRTKGKQAARATGGDLELVRQMLGHRSITSTQQYTDELQLDEVAALQRRLRNPR